jgi:hypothetical protein
MYDATQSMLEALKETDGKGGEALAKALEELPARVGTNGKTDAELQFSADDHDAFSTDYLSPYKMQDGEPVLDASLD